MTTGSAICSIAVNTGAQSWVIKIACKQLNQKMDLNWTVASSQLGDFMHADASSVNTWYWLEMAILIRNT